MKSVLPVFKHLFGEIGQTGGVAVCVKHDLVWKPKRDHSVPLLEAVWVETKLSQEAILIGTVYRPPNATVEYWQLIDQSLKKVLNTPHKFIVFGDFNSDFHHNSSPHLLDVLFLNNLQQPVTSPTRIMETTSSCFDLILTLAKTLFKTHTSFRLYAALTLSHALNWQTTLKGILPVKELY